MDERPAIDQMKSGFKLAGIMLWLTLTSFVFEMSYRDLTRPERQKYIVGSLILVTAIAAMLVTVRFWAKYFSGIAGIVAVRFTAPVFFGSKGRFTFLSAVTVSASLWFMAIACLQFNEESLSVLDQLTITGCGHGAIVGISKARCARP
jgi:hypothetical protein